MTEPAEQPTPPAVSESGGPVPAPPVRIEIEALDLLPAVAAWVTAHLDQHTTQGWSYAEAVADLLELAHQTEVARRADAKERKRLTREYVAAVRALTEEQQQAIDADNAGFTLMLGVGEAQGALAAAARLGLRVRWFDPRTGAEIDAPKFWPEPRLPNSADWGPAE
jgi:hypothetical protein